MSMHPTAEEIAVVISRLRSAGCVFAEDEAGLILSAAQTADHLNDMVEKRVAGLPLEPILGWAEFCGLRIAIGPGVFVPRRRTEFLVHQAVSLSRPGAVVLDLCCGSGAIGAAVAAALDGIELYAADIEPAAVQCARRNIVPGGGQVYEGDLYEPLPVALLGRVDVMVVNAPYVPTDAIEMMPPEARLYEPRIALDGGPDGLDVQRRIAAEAPRWLAPGGHLLIETSNDQAPRTVEIFVRAGLAPRITSSDAFGADIVIGTSRLNPARSDPPGDG